MGDPIIHREVSCSSWNRPVGPQLFPVGAVEDEVLNGFKLSTVGAVELLWGVAKPKAVAFLGASA